MNDRTILIWSDSQLDTQLLMIPNKEAENTLQWSDGRLNVSWLVTWSHRKVTFSWPSVNGKVIHFQLWRSAEPVWDYFLTIRGWKIKPVVFIYIIILLVESKRWDLFDVWRAHLSVPALRPQFLPLLPLGEVVGVQGLLWRVPVVQQPLRKLSEQKQSSGPSPSHIRMVLGLKKVHSRVLFFFCLLLK